MSKTERQVNVMEFVIVIIIILAISIFILQDKIFPNSHYPIIVLIDGDTEIKKNVTKIVTDDNGCLDIVTVEGDKIKWCKTYKIEF